MSMLKTMISLSIFVNNKIFIINQIHSFKDNKKLIEKFIKLKIKKMFKLENSKGKNCESPKNWLN